MALFFVAGLLYASWGIHIPTIKEQFGLSPGLLSLALFVLSGGSVAAMPRIGNWIARVGTRRACLVGGALMSACAALVLLAPWYGLLLPLLAVFGVAMATLDVAMNTEAGALESALRKPVMSSLHAMFSIGGIAGAAVGGALLARGMPAALHMALAALASALLIGVASRFTLPGQAASQAGPVKADAAPRRQHARGLFWLGLIALVALIAEGAMYDWSTVYARDVAHATPAIASAAYAAFSCGMALGRLGGDRLRARMGAPLLVGGSASLACAGMLAVLVVPRPMAALCGFTLMGLGLANMMPILFAAAMRVEGVHAAEGMARVAGIAYFGMLIGPVIIGLVAQLTSLSVGLAVVALCAALVAVLGPRVLRGQRV